MLNHVSETDPPAASSRHRKRDEARRNLLRAGLDEFLAYGFAAASTRRITADAGVSHGLLFHNFSSKAGLYLELVRFGLSEVAVDAETAAAQPLEFFGDTARKMLAMLHEQPRTARVFVFMDYAASRPGLVPEVDTLMGEYDVVQTSAPVIEAGQAAGEIRGGSPQALSLVFWAALQGVAREAFIDSTAELPDADWLLDLLRPRRSAP